MWIMEERLPGQYWWSAIRSSHSLLITWIPGTHAAQPVSARVRTSYVGWIMKPHPQKLPKWNLTGWTLCSTSLDRQTRQSWNTVKRSIYPQLLRELRNEILLASCCPTQNLPRIHWMRGRFHVMKAYPAIHFCIFWSLRRITVETYDWFLSPTPAPFDTASPVEINSGRWGVRAPRNSFLPYLLFIITKFRHHLSLGKDLISSPLEI